MPIQGALNTVRFFNSALNSSLVFIITPPLKLLYKPLLAVINN